MKIEQYWITYAVDSCPSTTSGSKSIHIFLVDYIFIYMCKATKYIPATAREVNILSILYAHMCTYDRKAEEPNP